MTKFIIPAALALSVFAVTGTGVVAPVGVANAHSNSCHTVTNYNKRYSCETHQRRRALTPPPQTRPDPEPPRILRLQPADPGGAGGGGGGQR
ncbi:MAG: hypothetical protein HKN11_03685 [Rhizobiales bacterium]|nr:hypothetical protein [Hyphomicrobiales bacterium]